jgi:HEAT repeat protein
VRAIDALIANLNDSSSEARAGAVRALGNIEPRALEAVIRAMADADSDVRRLRRGPSV